MDHCFRRKPSTGVVYDPRPIRPPPLCCKAVALLLSKPPPRDDDPGGSGGGSQANSRSAPPTPAVPVSGTRPEGGKNPQSTSSKLAGRAHLSLRNLKALGHSGLLVAILLAFRTYSVFNLGGVLDSSYDAQSVAVHNFPSPGIGHRTALLKVVKHHDGNGQGGEGGLRQEHDQSASGLSNDDDRAIPQHESCAAQVQPKKEEDKFVVSPGSCYTYDLFDRKQIKHGCFQTFKYILTLMSFTALISDPRVYNVTETPKDIIERILGDVQDKRIMTFEQCTDCRKRSLECARCKFQNSQLS